MFNFICVYLFSLIILVSSSAYSFEKIESEQLKFILGGVKVEVEKEFENFNFRSLSVRETGECDGQPTTCPKLHYYLVISTFDEVPDQAVYKLEPSQNWEIAHIDEIDSYGEYQKYLVICLKRTVPSEDISENWWKVKTLKIKINPWDFQILNQ